MLLERSVIDIIDNSGAVKVMLFAVNGKNKRRSVGVGSIVKGSVKKSTINGKVKKRDIVNVLITTTVFKSQRKDGSSIKFSKNTGIVINKANKEPVGTRVFGPVAREIKELGFNKVISMAPEVV